MYATYLRLHVHVHAGWRTVVRAAAAKLTSECRRDSARREARKRFYRQMLDYHRHDRELVSAFRL